MTHIHVISDLDYGFNEQSLDEDLTLPEETDLVIINGNVGTLKRGMFYAHALANKYSDVQIVYNFGELERYWKNASKSLWEIEDGMNVRILTDSWPKNLHWKDSRKEGGTILTLRNGEKVDIFTAYGFPKIVSYEGDWKDTYWYRNYCVYAERIDKLHEWPYYTIPEKTIVTHNVYPIWYTKEYMDACFEEIETKVKKWELDVTHQKILVTHLNPMQDACFANCKVRPYRIHLNGGIWITARTKVQNINFLGASLYSNPGRGRLARSQTFKVK